jgi:hypothetical protein
MIKGVIGSLIGGAIGAAIWAAIAYFTGYEVGYVAVGVGFLAGFGMGFGARDDTGTHTGVVAVVIALGAILVGKYGAVHLAIEKAAEEVQKSGIVSTAATMDDAQIYVAHLLVEEYQAAGKPINWPNGAAPEKFTSYADFPKDVWADMEARWLTLTSTQQEGYRVAAEQRFKAKFETIKGTIEQEGFLASFSFFDILWAFLAIGAAYKLGAGIGDDSDD